MTECEIVRNLLDDLNIIVDSWELDAYTKGFVEEMHKQGYKIVRALDMPHTLTISDRTITGLHTNMLCDCGRPFSDPIHDMLVAGAKISCART